MEKEMIIDKILKDAVQIFTKESLVGRLTSGKQLKIKLGADPSRPDLHLGHSVVLRKLKLFQELGHEITFVIGDFTGMIGDPSGRSKTRPALTLEETRRSGESYFRQVTKILDPEKTKIVYNSEWLGKMNFNDVISLASKYTVARIMERDDFKDRFEGGLPISLHELLYPLAQGYDSVALGTDIEVGGTDQTFNLLVGRSLQCDYGQVPQDVVTYPLLIGLDGVQKMSKSLDNYIGIDEPADRMFEKAMQIPDELMADYFWLTTDINAEEAGQWIKGDIREAHLKYAAHITTMYHDGAAAEKAEQRYKLVASGSAPGEMPVFELPHDDPKIVDAKIRLVDLLCKIGFAGSLSEARRNIIGKGVKINGETAEDPGILIDLNGQVVVQFGKGRFCKVVWHIL